MLPQNEERKRIIELRILRELTEYHKQQATGLTMQILAAKYARACNAIGGLPELIDQMHTAGLVRIEYTPNGARTVWPSNGIRVDKPKEKVWF